MNKRVAMGIACVCIHAHAIATLSNAAPAARPVHTMSQEIEPLSCALKIRNLSYLTSYFIFWT